MENTKSLKDDIQAKWDQFLIDSWISNKGAPMWRIIESFKIDNKLSDYPNLKRMPLIKEAHALSMDVFGYIAVYYSNISEYLISTKAGDSVRIGKIISLFGKAKPVLNTRSTKYLAKARSEAKKDVMKAASRTVGRGVYCERSSKFNGTDWSTCS